MQPIEPQPASQPQAPRVQVSAPPEQPTPATPCPICKRATQADQFGFVECACGWGGPGDPVESARGFSRWVTLFDRRQAAKVVRRELARIARTGKAASSRHLLYILLLSILSAAIYLIIGALFIGSIILCAQFVMQQVWLGAGLAGAIVVYLYYALFGVPHRIEGIVAPLTEYPRLAATLGEIAARLQVKPPQWVVLRPDAGFWIARRMLWGRAITPQVVLGVGAASLTQMSDPELRAVLAHELAHYKREDTFFVRYFGGAEQALHHIIDGVQAGISTNYKNDWAAHARSNSSLPVLVGVIVIWVVTLPLRFLWFGFHLLRMRLSRADEYEADSVTTQTYGAQAFAHGLMAVISTDSTLRGAGSGIVGDMRRHNNPNLFAELRRHYAELPADYIVRMRQKAAVGYRSLEQSHPITPDRIRAVLLVAPPEPARPFLLQPVSNILTPAGAPDAGQVELRLTEIMFARGKRRR